MRAYLPKLWCINRTNCAGLENYAVNQWAEKNCVNNWKYNGHTGFVYSTPVNSRGMHSMSDTDGHDLIPHSSFTEITFDEFKTLVIEGKTSTGEWYDDVATIISPKTRPNKLITCPQP